MGLIGPIQNSEVTLWPVSAGSIVPFGREQVTLSVVQYTVTCLYKSLIIRYRDGNLRFADGRFSGNGGNFGGTLVTSGLDAFGCIVELVFLL